MTTAAICTFFPEIPKAEGFAPQNACIGITVTQSKLRVILLESPLLNPLRRGHATEAVPTTEAQALDFLVVHWARFEIRLCRSIGRGLVFDAARPAAVEPTGATIPHETGEEGTATGAFVDGQSAVIQGTDFGRPILRTAAHPREQAGGDPRFLPRNSCKIASHEFRHDVMKSPRERNGFAALAVLGPDQTEESPAESKEKRDPEHPEVQIAQLLPLGDGRCCGGRGSCRFNWRNWCCSRNFNLNCTVV